MSAAITLVVLGAVAWVGLRYDALDTIAGILILGFILVSCFFQPLVMLDDMRGGYAKIACTRNQEAA